jgi:hypothetical protein
MKLKDCQVNHIYLTNIYITPVYLTNVDDQYPVEALIYVWDNFLKEMVIQ